MQDRVESPIDGSIIDGQTIVVVSAEPDVCHWSSAAPSGGETAAVVSVVDVVIDRAPSPTSVSTAFGQQGNYPVDNETEAEREEHGDDGGRVPKLATHEDVRRDDGMASTSNDVEVSQELFRSAL